jgi:hypothetical protein
MTISSPPVPVLAGAKRKPHQHDSKRKGSSTANIPNVSKRAHKLILGLVPLENPVTLQLTFAHYFLKTTEHCQELFSLSYN